jgi:hypothetical protein
MIDINDIDDDNVLVQQAAVPRRLALGATLGCKNQTSTNELFP